ncbi:MAG: hypothetical protein Q4G68_11420 [Planctomycetia bacterium]|nr:hypothetical protein [Planctomycetia bacterium]
MGNTFVIDFNGRGCEAEIPGKLEVSEEQSSEDEAYFLLTEIYSAGEREVTVCVYASRPFADIGFRLYCPTAEELRRVDTILYNFFGPKAYKAFFKTSKK